MESKQIAVLGAGSWGTALAVSLGGNDHQVRIWARDPKQVELMDLERENKRYLPGVKLPDPVELYSSMEEAVKNADVVLFSTPAQQFRNVLKVALPYLTPSMTLVNVAKGIEQKTLLRLSQIAEEIAPGCQYVALSGPSHAEEVGRALPTTIVAASRDRALAQYIQDIFMNDRLRIYTNTDMVGVELGGALKNIIALGAGASDGMKFGDDAKAALMTRGIAEITRLGVRLGAEEATFSGLTGIGDLIVTCTSMHSRNRRCGIMIGEGVSPEEAIKRVGMVVEGMYTTEAARQLAQKMGVEMPITEQIYQVIKGNVKAHDAVMNLMTRQKKHETEETMLV